MKVAVAMSGGVDSSVAAAILKQQGHEVVGIHMRLYDHYESKPGRCCGAKDMMDGREVADKIGIPYHVINMRRQFESAVVDNLVNEYIAGRTPNPCTVCNGRIKFGTFMKTVDELGCDMMATGHYAKVRDGSLYVADDQSKDQTYFLFTIPHSILKRTMMPMGNLNKSHVRDIAADIGLGVADKPDSQEVCFIPDGDHAALIKLFKPGLDGSGNIVLADGTIVGKHDGYFRYTIGQRKGVRVGGLTEPHYVSDINPTTKDVVISPRSSETVTTLRLGALNWLGAPPNGEELSVRYRYRKELRSCEIALEGRKAFVRMDPTEDKIACGQGAAIYNSGRCVGGGWIETVS